MSLVYYFFGTQCIFVLSVSVVMYVPSQYRLARMPASKRIKT